MAPKAKAADVLRHDLLPGERITASSAVASDPSRWAAVLMLPVALALAATGLATWLGSLPATPVVGVALPVLALGFQFLPRRMYIALTDQRLICRRISRLRGTPQRAAFAVPLADLRILGYRSGKFGASIRCDIPGRRPVLLHWSRAGRKDFAKINTALVRSGAFANFDPPYPSAKSPPHGDIPRLEKRA
jgi:hypothetical protein